MFQIWSNSINQLIEAQQKHLRQIPSMNL
jgi:hypothetical protein